MWNVSLLTHWGPNQVSVSHPHTSLWHQYIKFAIKTLTQWQVHQHSSRHTQNLLKRLIPSLSSFKFPKTSTRSKLKCVLEAWLSGLSAFLQKYPQEVWVFQFMGKPHIKTEYNHIYKHRYAWNLQRIVLCNSLDWKTKHKMLTTGKKSFNTLSWLRFLPFQNHYPVLNDTHSVAHIPL